VKWSYWMVRSANWVAVIELTFRQSVVVPRQEGRDLSMGLRTKGFPVKKLNASWHERRSAP